MRKNKLLLLLALLLTAATGAWAQEAQETQTWDSGDCTVTFSEGVLTVSGAGAMADYKDYNLTPWYGNDIETIVIESGVTGIGKYALASCYNLESVSIPASMTSIGFGAFEDCGRDAATAMTVSFAEGSTPLTIGEGAFHYANLKSIDIPNRVTSIGRSAFSSCSNLESVSIPASVTSISEEAFRNCSMLANVYIFAPSLTTYGTDAFASNATGRKIYVLSDAVDTYKAGWPDYAADIEAMNLYATSMKDDVKDADKWTITPNPAAAGQTVTLQYNGRLKVKGVKATSVEQEAAAKKATDLSTITANYTASDGETLTGTLVSNVKISIADGATVTLDGVTINGVNNTDYEWAGITCEGDATIILSGTNTVKGFYEDYPGIQAAAGKTLTIQGEGSLTASSYRYGAGIGGKMKVACGNIEIQGGTITATSVNCGAGIGGGYGADCGNITISGGTVNATGGERGAGIGGGKRLLTSGSCGNIIISGGTVTATGGEYAAGIGGGNGLNAGNPSSCGTITITTGVTKVTATMGSGATNSIGAGKYGTCGTVTIGGTVYWENNAAVNGGHTYLAQATIEYPAAAKPAATVTTAPTGAAVVGVGKTTELVSGGVAYGGTLMYRVTTENTKPTSTDGFSADVPTAKDITASGKVYVWYYVKGDDTHSDSEIAATAIEVPVADKVWDATNVKDLAIFGSDNYEMEDITLSGKGDNMVALWKDYGDPTMDGISFEMFTSGGFTFTAPTGKAFTKIEMKLTGSAGWDIAHLGTGWAFVGDDVNMIYTVMWKGSAAASTVGLLTGDDMFNGDNVKSIAFYLSDAE